VRLELDYGDFRGLILRVAPGTLADNQTAPFGLVPLRGDFDCRDQRRLPYCHPTLVGQDWFTEPESLEDVEFVTVHQPGDAPTVMDFEANFGIILAMAGFRPTAEFWQETVQVQVAGTYCHLPGGVDACEDSGGDPVEEPENQTPTAAIEVVQCESLTCQFEGTSSVDPDGTIVAYSWDFGDGAMSTASEPVHTYSAAGTYTVTLTVTDNEGLTGTAQTQVQVSAPIAGDITLMVEAFKVQGVQHARLLWSGASASMIDIYRDSNFLIQVANTGEYVDNLNRRGRGSYTYHVCEAGTTMCSEPAIASFQ
jgi:chitodextrinase